MDRKAKWEKIESGFLGNYQKWKYGERVFITGRGYGAYSWCFYELPNNNSGQEIYKATGDFPTVRKKFKLFISQQTLNK